MENVVIINTVAIEKILNDKYHFEKFPSIRFVDPLISFLLIKNTQQRALNTYKVGCVDST